MASTRDDFLSTARTAADLLREPAVAAAWRDPSALMKFSVGGLAGHLAYQVLAVQAALAEPEPQEPTVPLLGHYERVEWIDAGIDDDINVYLRRGGEELAADGPDALSARVDAAIGELAGALPSVRDRPVRLPFWGPYSLMLDDFLVTRMMELAVHSDDLAVSTGISTPELPYGAIDTVTTLLTRLSVRRHGPTPVLRALSRAERAPDSIAAF